MIISITTVDAKSEDTSALFLGPSPYRGFVDSPFRKLFTHSEHSAYFHLEDFEDGALNTPGTSASPECGALGYPQSDSVDENDGTIDGKGDRGGSCFSKFRTPVFVFRFDADALGGLPTHAGVVWTDSNGPRRVDAILEAFDAAGDSLGTLGPATVGDNTSYTGDTDEDRFFGVMAMAGISAISLKVLRTENWELDHRQYGRYVGLPPSGGLGDGL